ncbi:MAG: hypothetical protein ACI86H_001535 [bacterium]|jgi:hypothetical protein
MKIFLTSLFLFLVLSSQGFAKIIRFHDSVNIDLKVTKMKRYFGEGILTKDTPVRIGKYSVVLAGNTELRFSISRIRTRDRQWKNIHVIKTAFLAKTVNLNIGGITVPFRKNGRIGFSRYNTVLGGDLARVITVKIDNQNISFGPRMSRFRLSKYGLKDLTFYSSKNRYAFKNPLGLYSGYLAKGTTFRSGSINVPLQMGKRISFYAKGGLRRGTLSRNLTIRLNGKPLTLLSGKAVSFIRAGTFSTGYLAKPFTVQFQGKKITLASFKYFGLFSRGGLSSGTPSHNVTLKVGGKQYTFMSGKPLRFQFFGKGVSYGWLAKNTTVRVLRSSTPVVARAGTRIVFDRYGKVRYANKRY